MNCKQGDLAIVIRSVRGNEGKIVRCVSPLKIIEAWTVEPDFNPEVLGIPTFPDAWLRPIRDQDGEDEMLRIAGKPTEKREWFKPNLTPTVKVVVR